MVVITDGSKDRDLHDWLVVVVDAGRALARVLRGRLGLWLLMGGGVLWEGLGSLRPK